MNTLKRIYVIAYIIGAVQLTIIGVQGLVCQHHMLASLGVMMTALPIVIVLTMALITQRMARTSANLPILLVLGFVGVGLAAWDAHMAHGPRDLVYMALAGWVGALLYVFWYSRFGRTPSPVIAVGEGLAAFEVTNVDDELDSSATLTQQDAIIIFIRGNWCPLCMGQVNEMAAGMERFAEKGIRVSFIAPQSLGKTKALAKGRPDGMHFYSDLKNDAARILKIHNPAGLPFGMELMGYRSETVLPTVIATSKGGEILWTHETDNYRVRPTVDELLAVFQE